MPRVADHPARLAQICGGVRAAAREDGLGAVTIARAAHAAGVSVGMVQHYFASKEDLLVETLERVLADILARVERATAAAEADHRRIEQMLADGLEQLLPLDEERREETRLRLGFAGLAIEHAALRAHQSRFADTLHARVARAIDNAGACGEIPDPTAVDTELEATALLALTHGLSTQILTDDPPARTSLARRVIATRMRALFPGACSHS